MTDYKCFVVRWTCDGKEKASEVWALNQKGAKEIVAAAAGKLVRAVAFRSVSEVK